MPATKSETTKVQLNLKSGNDLLNIYATNAREMDALVTEVIDVTPELAARFGLKKSGSDAPVALVKDLPDTGAAAGDTQPAAQPAPSAPVPTSDEGLSPREKARLRLQGGK